MERLRCKLQQAVEERAACGSVVAPLLQGCAHDSVVACLLAALLLVHLVVCSVDGKRSQAETKAGQRVAPRVGQQRVLPPRIRLAKVEAHAATATLSAGLPAGWGTIGCG